MPAISITQVRIVFAAIAAVCSFLLVQPDVLLSPIATVVIGAVIVALAVINPQTVAARTGTS